MKPEALDNITTGKHSIAGLYLDLRTSMMLGTMVTVEEG